LSVQSLPTDPSRRQVLCGLMVALLAPGALAACGDGDNTGTSTATPGTTDGGSPGTGSPGTGSTSAPGGSANALAQLSDVPVGGGTLVDGPDGKKVLLVQPSQGTVKAYDPTCTHQGTQVTPPQAGVIVCPNHGSEFDPATGEAKKGPAASPLNEIPVKVEGTAIVPA
jgi:cytochrome b6-f complex iron-sulfur subunit